MANLQIKLKEMSKEERIEQLEAYKLKERFTLDDWEDREVEMPIPEIVELMRLEVIKFTNFLISQLKANVSNLQTQTQLYFNAWDNEFYDQDQTEFIVEVEYEAMRIAGVDGDKMMI
ncbi:hypothetical protein [Emticicia sp. W12TSBA100-4]|uniref:hypothetical protein n=1 Tax=Emticicia sp. W12TSBA100-4 TaxID=3160965 RepID=UPI003305D7A6